MAPLLDLLGKFLGAQWLWNLATLALLLQAYKAFSKLQKLPDDALSKSEFQKYKEAADARFSMIENPFTLISSRVSTLWSRSGISDPHVPRVDVRIDRLGDRTFSENPEIVEADPWPRRRATDRLQTPIATSIIEPRDEARYGRDREDRGSDPGRRRSTPIPREEPHAPPSDRPFDSDPRDRDPGDAFDEDSPVPPRPRKR